MDLPPTYFPFTSIDIATTSPPRNTGELMPLSRISLLSVRLFFALCVYIKLMRRRSISYPEVHLMGSELIGFLLFFWLSLNSSDMLFAFLEALLLFVPVSFRSSCINLRTQ